ncbi:MAG TPA: DUF5916 domain-containing protein [Gemmatimonadales bacterium]|nr:DUF5916 domain-containing protein [Gemmatimonadales bacterium]
MRSLAVTVLLCAAPCAARLGAQEPLTIPRIEGPVEIDGRLDEPVWDSLAPLPMVTYVPTFGLAPSESTEVRVAHDGRAIYVGARLYDSDPRGVQAWTRARDQDDGGDFVNVLLDTFNDSENAVTFSTTPAGPRLDFGLVNDGEGDNAATNAWNGVWDVRVRRDERGWYAEFRIPFSTLRYQATSDGTVRMRLIVNRLIGRKSERVIFPAIPPRWSFGMFKPSQAREVEFRGVETRRQYRLTPYGLGGHRRDAWLDPALGGYGAQSEVRSELGGDAKLALSNHFNLDLTANTDFAETEADDQRLNLTRFPLLFPERRQFFIERAGVFGFDLDDVNRLFHSRRIGLTDDGTPVRIYGGARLVGRTGQSDLGVLTMQAARAGAVPGANVGVARYRRRVLNAESFVGAMLTTRLGDVSDGAAGVDASLRLGGVHYARMTLSASTAADSAPAGDRSVWERAALGARFDRRTAEGLGGTVGVLRLGEGFTPPLGFLEANGLLKADGRVAYGIFTREGTRLRVLTPAVAVARTWDLRADVPQTTTVRLEAKAELRSGGTATVGVERQSERVLASLRFADAVAVPPGDYDATVATLYAATSPGRAASATLDGRVGGFYGGSRASAIVTALWHPTPPLTLSGEYQHERLSVGGGSATLRLARARAAVTWTSQLSTSVVLQHSSAAHVTSLNARARMNFREGSDLWLVYDHVFNTARARLQPVLPLTQARVLLLKYTWTFGN